MRVFRDFRGVYKAPRQSRYEYWYPRASLQKTNCQQTLARG